MDTATDRFEEALQQLIEYYTKEYTMTYNQIVGVLETIKFDLLMENYDREYD